ncbi:MAG TPA: hypothetical protein VE174_02890 [Actinomycetota bacterium]|nr:hypothetical protein [Actinomycetota bacterium]
MKRILCAALLLTIFAGACGGGGALPGESVAQAAELAKEQGSANVSMAMDMTIPNGSISMTGEGAFDLKGNRGHLTFTATGTGDGAAASEQIGTMETVYDEFVVYMKMPILANVLPEGKTWIMVDLQKAGEASGIDFQQLTQMGQNNPMQQLDYLQGSKNIEEVGTEEVRGTETTHYKGVIDFDELQKTLPTEVGGSIDKIQELSGIDQAPIEVWLDGDGLPRRVKYDFAYDMPAGSGPMSDAKMSITMEFFDYGTDVTVDVPAAEEVFDPTEAQQG